MLALRPFGATGLAVSPIGLGTVKFGRDKGLKHPGSFAIPTDAEARDLIALAADLGINLIDTAPAYGTSEERLGAPACRTAQPMGNLHQGRRGVRQCDRRRPLRFQRQNTSASASSAACRGCKVEALDIVLVHSDGNDVAIIEDGALDVLAALKAEGKIRAFGMSTKTIEGGLMASSRPTARW